jgi:hypothetical protein
MKKAVGSNLRPLKMQIVTTANYLLRISYILLDTAFFPDKYLKNKHPLLPIGRQEVIANNIKRKLLTKVAPLKKTGCTALRYPATKCTEKITKNI